MPPVAEPITVSGFANFYVPLVMTSLLQVAVQPIIGAALSRMSDPIGSLAVWPVVYSLIIVLNSCAIAYIEAVVVLLDGPNSLASLRRFSMGLAAVLTSVILFMNFTPLAQFWFATVAALPPELVEKARISLWLVSLLPGLVTLDSWFQGVLLNSRRTRGIIEAVVLSLAMMAVSIGAGMLSGRYAGVYVGMVALVAAALVRNIWLWLRARPALQSIQRRQRREMSIRTAVASPAAQSFSQSTGRSSPV